MKNIYIPILIIMCLYIPMISQQISKFEIQGNTYLLNNSYTDALKSYTKADVLTIEGKRNMANCYHILHRNTEAELVYANMLTYSTNIIPEDYYNYAIILKINRKYDKSTIAMNKFCKLKPYDLRSIDYEKNKYEYMNLLKDNGRYKVTNIDINSESDDFGTNYYEDKLVFASNRQTSDKNLRKTNWTGTVFSNIYIAEVLNGELRSTMKFDKKVNINQYYWQSSFSNNNTYMAFTTNNFDKKVQKVDLHIFFSSLIDGVWSKPESFILNSPDYSVGQPCLSKDGKSMYFTSDMPGGFGGADIYLISKNEKNVWGKPKNLGNSINTEGDEMYPFIDEKFQLLFFTSNGRFGLGGLDIFVCKSNNLVFSDIRNLGYPVNTEYDDYGLIVNYSTKKGYYTSNRNGGKGNDDIYYLSIIQNIEFSKTIIGSVADKGNNPIAKSFVSLFNADGSIQDTVTSTKEGEYFFIVNSDRYYKLTGEKIGYTTNSNSFDTFRHDTIQRENLILDIEPQKKEISTPNTTRTEKFYSNDNKDYDRVFEFKPKNIYFDFGQFVIRPDAVIELDKIVKAMNENPNMAIEFTSHTDCRSTMLFNQKLSDQRAKSTADYIKKRISNPDRIHGTGRSESELLVDCNCDDRNKPTNCSEKDHEQNRRSEFHIVSQEYINIKQPSNSYNPKTTENETL